MGAARKFSSVQEEIRVLKVVWPYQTVEEEAVVEGVTGVLECDGPVLRPSRVENELGNCFPFVLDVWIPSSS